MSAQPADSATNFAAPLAAAGASVARRLGIGPTLFAHSTFLFGAILGGQILGFAVQIMVARELGTGSYGIYAYAFTLANLLALVAGWGGDRVLVRFVSDYRSRGESRLVRGVVGWAFSRMGLAALAGGAGLALAGTGLSGDGPERMLAFALAGLCLPFLVGATLAESALRACGAQAWANLPNRMLRPVLMGGGFLLLLLLAPGPMGAGSAVAANLAAIAATCLLGIWALRRRIGQGAAAVAPPRRQWRRAGLAFGLGTLALYLNQQLDILLLGQMADDRTVGIYAVVVRVVSILAFANIAVVAAVQPMLARQPAAEGAIGLQSVLTGGARFAFLVNLACGLPLLVLAEPVLRVFGEPFVAGAGALRILALGYMLASLVSLSQAGLAMRGHEREATAVLLAGCVLTLVLNVLLIPPLGIDGAATATATATVAWNLGLFVMARRKLGVLALPFGGPSNRQERHEARKRPPLAIFIPTLDGGGAERIVLHLARGFQEVGLATDIVVMRNEGAYRDQIPPGVRVVALGSRKTWLSVLDLARYLRRERPERVYATMDDANLVALLARFLVPHRVRIVCGIHNTPSLALDTRSNWRNATKVALLRLLYPQAAAVVAVSQGAAADSRRMFRLDSDQVTVIPNPVLTPELAKLAEAPVRHPWFQSGGPPVVLACGRLTGQKDYPNLLQAFAILRQHREVRLVILGEGEARPELEHLRHRLGLEGSVDLPGFAANPYAYMARCDLYVLSSRFEGSPVVLVEALACGARIVATDCPSGPAETLAGVEGSRLVPVDDSAALARAMAVMLDEAAPRPGVRHLARFDYRAAARRYLELLP